jgi:hypothetical protein
MSNANAAREILALMKGNQFTPEEAMRRLGMALGSNVKNNFLPESLHRLAPSEDQ